MSKKNTSERKFKGGSKGGKQKLREVKERNAYSGARGPFQRKEKKKPKKAGGGGALTD